MRRDLGRMLQSHQRLMRMVSLITRLGTSLPAMVNVQTSAQTLRDAITCILSMILLKEYAISVLSHSMCLLIFIMDIMDTIWVTGLRSNIIDKINNEYIHQKKEQSCILGIVCALE